MQAYKLDGLKSANAQAAKYMHISAHQGALMVLCGNIGASFLLLPGILAGQFQTSAWFVLVLGGAVGMLCCVLIHAVYKVSESKSFEELMQHAFGKIMGNAVSRLVRLASLFRAGITIGIFACTVKGLVLPRQSNVTLCLLLCAALLFVLRCDATTSARICSIGMLFFASALALMLTCAPAMHSAYILPIELPAKSELSQMVFYILFCASGADILLYLYPHLQKNRLRSGIIGSLLGCGAKLYALYICCSVFGFYAIASYPFAPISMYKSNNLIGIDRPELILMIFFTLISLTPAHLYASAAIRTEKESKSSSRRDLVLTLFAGAALFVFAVMIKSIEQIPHILELLGMLFLFTGIFLPLFLLFFSLLKRRSV